MTQHAHKKYHTVDQIYQRILSAYAEKYPVNEKLQKAVKGKTRRIHIHLADGESAAFLLDNEKLARIPVAEVGKAEIRIESTVHDLLSLFNKELKPVEAYLTKRVKVHASMGDLLLAKSFLG